MPCCVQNWKANDAGGLVAPEFAAMLDHAVLVELQQIYISNGTVEQERRAIAQCTGRPLHEVDFCFLVNFDNDTRHAYPRQVLLEPRYSQPECERRMHLALDTVHQEIRQELRGGAGMGLGEGGMPEVAQVLRARAHELGCSVDAYVRFRWAQWDPQARILWPEQTQPQSAVTPELNMPAEHCVNTFKVGVGRAINSRNRLHSWHLRYASTYHQIVVDVLQRAFGKGEGQHDPDCSVRKLLCAARILATPKGQWCTVRHRFKGMQAEHEYKVLGTGGWWISEGRWT